MSNYQELKNHSKELELLVAIGLNYQKIGKLESATTFFLQALGIAKYIENRKEEAHILVDLAEIYHKLGNIEDLLPLLKQAEETLGARETKWSPLLKSRLDTIKFLLPPQ